MGIDGTNTNGSHGISQHLDDELGSIPSSSGSTVIANSQGVAFQSTQVASQPRGRTPGIELAANPKKRERGPNLKPEEQWTLDFNEKMQPIGPNRTEFMKYLGKLARNGIRLPLTYEAWNDIPEDMLDILWNDIQAIATCPLAYKSNCMKSLDEKWRSWKSVLKRTYFKGKSKEEALANIPTRVQPEQWNVLVEYWSLEKVQCC